MPARSVQIANPVVCSLAERRNRPAAIARDGDSPSPNVRARICKRICGCESPPIVPSTAASRPSRSVTIAGVSVCGGCLPGAYSAGCPSSTEKPSPRLCRLMPVDGSNRWLPKPEAFDWMSDTPTPSPSTTHSAVVSPTLAPTPRWERAVDGDRFATRREALGAHERAAVGRVVQHRGAVVARLLRRLDQQVRPERIVGVVRKWQAISDPGAREQEVALRAGRDPPKDVPERLDADRVDPSRPGVSKSAAAYSPLPSFRSPSPNSPS